MKSYAIAGTVLALLALGCAQQDRPGQSPAADRPADMRQSDEGFPQDNQVQPDQTTPTQPNHAPANRTQPGAVSPDETEMPPAPAPLDEAAPQRPDKPAQPDQAARRGTATPTAVAVLQPVGDSGVHGVVHFRKQGDVVRVEGRITGLSPGKHGFHVHEFGDLTDMEKGESAGDHFNPTDQPHGPPDGEARHVGDLGNIEANDQGIAIIEIEDRVLTLDGPYSILGRSLVVHEGEDMFTQPSGDAGGRLAFGVIGVAQHAAVQPKAVEPDEIRFDETQLDETQLDEPQPDVTQPDEAEADRAAPTQPAANGAGKDRPDVAQPEEPSEE